MDPDQPNAHHQVLLSSCSLGSLASQFHSAGQPSEGFYKVVGMGRKPARTTVEGVCFSNEEIDVDGLPQHLITFKRHLPDLETALDWVRRQVHGATVTVSLKQTGNSDAGAITVKVCKVHAVAAKQRSAGPGTGAAAWGRSMVLTPCECSPFPFVAHSRWRPLWIRPGKRVLVRNPRQGFGLCPPIFARSHQALPAGPAYPA